MRGDKINSSTSGTAGREGIGGPVTGSAEELEDGETEDREEEDNTEDESGEEVAGDDGAAERAEPV